MRFEKPIQTDREEVAGNSVSTISLEMYRNSYENTHGSQRGS